MSNARKDTRGRVLRKGECQRGSDNRYIYSYMDPLGKRRYVYANDLAKLREKEQEIRRAEINGVIPSNITVNEMFDRVMFLNSGIKDSTRNTNKYAWNHCVRDAFGQKKVQKVRYSDVLFFYKNLKSQGLAKNTIGKINDLLHMTFELAVKDDVIVKNPVKGAFAETYRNGEDGPKKRQPLTAEQQKRFLCYVKDHPVFGSLYPLFIFLFGTGCRAGEATGLIWNDVDFDNRLITIRRSLTYFSVYERDSTKGKWERHISTPKTINSMRTIPLMSIVCKALKDEYDRQRNEGFCEDVVDGVSGFVFIRQNGHVCDYNYVNQEIKRILKYYNKEEREAAEKENRDPVLIPRFSCHICRHTFASRLCEQETNIKVIQELMGHADIRTTMNIYAEVSKDVLQLSLDNLEKNTDIF